MRQISSLLARITKALDRKFLTKQFVSDVVKSHTNITLSLEDIEIKNDVLYLSLDSIKKNEIYLKEELIKTDLAETHNIFLSRIVYR